MQEEAVKGWIALGDLGRAELGMRRIGDWRRGEATALVAQARAARGRPRPGGCRRAPGDHHRERDGCTESEPTLD
ncbi:MAG: hypothetical protein ACKOHI_11965 [Phycisphaerales bacterium]